MELSEEREQSANQSVDVTPAQTAAPSPVRSTGTTTPSYVYALGRVTPRFPSLAVEKEFAQTTGRAETTGLTDRQALQSVLSQRSNRYLARQLCWVLEIEGLETYLLVPRDPADFDLLIEALRPTPSPLDVDVVVGVRGPFAPPEMCNGLMIPIVAFDQIYSFDRDALIKAIPRPEKVTAKEFEPAAGELFGRIMQMADNAGATDEDRALNYLAVRYPAIYATAADAFGRNDSLTAVAVHPSSLSGTRNIVEVVFSYTHRTTDVTEKFFVRVDVTEEFPFLVTKLSPYYDR
jgi:PatG Domain